MEIYRAKQIVDRSLSGDLFFCPGAAGSPARSPAWNPTLSYDNKIDTNQPQCLERNSGQNFQKSDFFDVDKLEI